MSDNSLQRVHTRAEIYQDDPQPGDCMVWSLDKSGDGGIYCVIFAGPEAEARAVEYAKAKYDETIVKSKAARLVSASGG